MRLGLLPLFLLFFPVAASAQPVAQVTPSYLDFELTATAAKRTLPLSIANAGNEPLQVDSVNLVDSQGLFQIDGVPALPASIAAGQSLSLELTLTPAGKLGALSAELDIDSSDPVARHIHVPLVGIGVVPPVPAPTSLTFFNQLVGAVSAPQMFEVENTLDRPLAVRDVTLAGTNPNQFNIAGDNRDFTLPPGAKRAFAISHRPVSGGTHTAVALVNFTTLPPATVQLHGTALLCGDSIRTVEVPEFGEVFVGLRSPPAAARMLVTACMFPPFTISAITSDSDDFVIDTSAVGTQFNMGSIISIPIQFAPTAGGLRSGHITVSARGLNAPIWTLPVRGTGIKPTVTPIQSPTSGCSLSRSSPSDGMVLLLFALPLAVAYRRRRKV